MAMIALTEQGAVILALRARIKHLETLRNDAYSLVRDWPTYHPLYDQARKLLERLIDDMEG